MSWWTNLRDGVESAAAVAGNYFVPGSGLITSHLVSDGSQDQLNSTLGRVAMIGSGIAGGINLASPGAGMTAGQSASMDSLGNEIGASVAGGELGAGGTMAAAGGAGAVGSVEGAGLLGSMGAGAAAGAGASTGLGGTMASIGSMGSGLLNSVGGLQNALGIGGALAGLGSSLSTPRSTTTTSQNTLDPRMQALIYGDGTTGNTGMTGQITGLLNQPRSPGMTAFGSAADQYMGANGGQSLAGMQGAANGLMGSSIAAPSMGAAQAQGTPGMSAAQVQATPGMQAQNAQAIPNMQAASAMSTGGMQAGQSGAASINAPRQNSTDVSGAYSRLINDDAGANPYLTRALQSGVDQTNASYERNQTSATNNLMRNILPSIGHGAQMAGGYGGTRQGIAEGNALSDYAGQMSNANLQLGLANSANTTGQQAAAFNAGQDRTLAAANNLSGNQYAAATQNANNATQSGIANAGFATQAGATNATLAQQTALANAGYGQQANLANYQGGMQMALANQQAQNAAAQQNYQGNLQTNMANGGFQSTAGQTNYQGGLQTNLSNAGYQNVANQYNLQAGLTTNQLNSANRATGISANSGLLNSAYNFGANNDTYGLNRTGAVSGMLTPYTGLGSGSTNTTPLYSSAAGSTFGGAMAGLGLYNAYNNATGGGSGGGSGIGSSNSYANNNYLSS